MTSYENTKDIHDTAFWMAGCRAELPELSKDIYAGYWLNEASKKKHKEYIRYVSPTENITLSLRNRFFLEEITSYLAQEPEAVFINIGAGFSSYPFLMAKDRIYCEIDCTDNIRKKKQKIKQLQDSGLLPKRDIRFYSVDLDDLSQIDSLADELKDFVGDRKSFVLLEGLIYYLSTESVEKLFKLAAAVQTQDSRLGLNSWTPDAFDYPVYKRFEEFFRLQHEEEPPAFIYHNPDSFRDIDGYKLVQQTDYVKLSKRFGMSNPLKTEDDVFWETISILKKR